MDVRETQLRTHIMSRPPHYHRDFPLVLLWSPKSGCTTLVKWFFDQIGLLEQALQYNPWVHHFEFEVYKRSPDYYADVLREMLASKRHTVKLVRNPYARAVSAFLILALLENKLFDDVRATIVNHPAVRRVRGEGITFRRFLTYLAHAGQEGAGVNMHFAPQYMEGEEHDVDQYIYLENLTGEIRALERVHGLRRSNLARLSKSSHHTSSGMRYTGAYADVNLLDPHYPRFPTADSFYDDETEALVRLVYRQDYAAYGYPLIRSRTRS